MTDSIKAQGSDVLAFTLTRLYDAPRELVFKVWTERDHVVRWSVPPGYALVQFEQDVRTGGSYVMAIRASDGAEYRMRGVYRDVTAPARVICSFAVDAANGDPGHDMLVTVTFDDVNGNTGLTLHQGSFATIADREAHESGMTSCLDLLGAYLTELKSQAPI